MTQAEIVLHTRDHPCPSDDTDAYCIDGTRLIDDLRRLKTSAKPRPAKNNLLWCACTKTKPNELAVFLSKNFTADWRSHCQIDANTKYVHVTPELAEFVARFATAHDVAEAIKTWVADGCVARNPELAVGRARATGNLGKAADVSARTVENDAAGVAVERSPASNDDRALIGSHTKISDAPTGGTIANPAVPSFDTTDVADPNAVTTDNSDVFADFAFTANTVKSRKLTTESGLKQTERGTTSTFVDLVNSDATADEVMVDATEPPSLEKVRAVLPDGIYWDAELRLHLHKETGYINIFDLMRIAGRYFKHLKENKATKLAIFAMETMHGLKSGDLIKRYHLGKAVLNGDVEIETPNGKIDVLTATEIIEVKMVTNWKHAFGQLCCYAVHYPDHRRRVHLFGSKEDNEKFKPEIQRAAEILGVHATFEDVSMQTTVPVKQTLPTTAESTMCTLDCNSSTSQHTGENDFVSEKPIDALLAHEKKLLDLETLRTARECQLTEQAALRAERGKYQKATEYAIQTNTALRCFKKCAIAKTKTHTAIDTTNTVTNANAATTAAFDAANAPGDEIVTPNAARATVTTLLPSQFEPDATVNADSVATVALRERSDTEVAAGVDVDDAIDSDDDELMHNMQTVPTVAMDDADAAEDEYEFVPAINTTVCLDNKYTDVYAFCASNGKRWRKYLENVHTRETIEELEKRLGWISPAKHAEVALIYMRYSESDVTLAKDILHGFDEANGTRTQSLVRE
eukprot:gene15403-18230_t